MIRKFFSPPHFDNERDNFRARFINGFAWILLLILAASMIPQLISKTPDYTIIVLPGLMVVMALSLFLLRKGHVTLSAIILIVLSWLGITFQASTAEGVKDVVVVAYIAVGFLSSIILNPRSGSIIVFISVLALALLAFLQIKGIIIPRVQEPQNYARDLALIFAAIGVLIQFSTSSLMDAVRRANTSEQALIGTNKSLQELNAQLEERVAERTLELEVANQRNQRRARQFEAIAQVARVTTSSQETQALLQRLTEVISEQFGFYHVGIFLIDEHREYAVLMAANSEGGRRMVQRGHRLAFGQTGIVGFVAATGTPRIALDVGMDAVYFSGVDLPDTRSELALPLRAAGEIIGVLDVQSVESNAFQTEDVEILSTLADQVTIAIQNARSYETTQELLKEAQRTSGTYLNESWKVLQSQAARLGYMISGNTLKSLSKPIMTPHINKAVRNKQSVVEGGEKPVLAIPIRLREDVIGVLNIRPTEEHDWDPDEVDIAEAVADRLSLAIETSLLLETTQRRAEIERVTSEISGKISSSTQFESILRTAAEELSRVLGGSEVIVQLQSPDLSTEAN